MANYKVNFRHVSTLPSAGVSAGDIYFVKNAQQISVWTGSAWENYGGSITNASYEDGKLTISKANSSENIVLDFSDVASSSSLNAILVPLRQDVNNLQTATGIADGATAPSWNSNDSSALKATGTLKAGIEAVDAQAKTNATAIGTISSLTTSAKGNLVSAINEVDGAIDAEESRATGVEGSLEGLTTTEKGNLVAAINEVDAHADANASAISAEVTRATDKEAELQTAINGKVASVAKGNDGSYFTTTIGGSATAPTVAGAVTVQKVSTASADLTAPAMGLAEASDVKSYVDGKISTEVSDRNTAIANAFANNKHEGAITADSVDENKYVTAAQVAAFASGVAGAMHFRGVVDSLEDVENPSAGDVCLIGTAEYVYSEDKEWQLFGDEGVYATQTGLSTEITRATNKEAELAGSISENAAAIAANASAISAEETRAKGAEADLAEGIADNADAITSEASRAAAAEQVNANAISAEITRATGAEEALDARLDALEGDGEGSVAAALADAKAYTDTKVGAEETRAKGIESGLRTDVDKNAADILANATDISNEETRAKAAEKVNSDAIALLNGSATTEGSVAYAVNAEASRINAIVGTPDTGKTIQREIDDLESAVSSLSTDVDERISGAIDALDAEKSNTASGSGEAASSQIKVTVTETAGLLTNVAVVAPLFETAAQAELDIDAAKADLIGDSNDAATEDTIYGAKAYADNLLAWDWS